MHPCIMASSPSLVLARKPVAVRHSPTHTRPRGDLQQSPLGSPLPPQTVPKALRLYGIGLTTGSDSHPCSTEPDSTSCLVYAPNPNTLSGTDGDEDSILQSRSYACPIFYIPQQRCFGWPDSFSRKMVHETKRAQIMRMRTFHPR